MAYLSNIPNANDFLSDSQVNLKDNFIAIKQLVDINHATFGDPKEGKHFRIDFPVQAPAPVFGVAGENGLYNFLNADTAKNELYVHKQTQAGTADIPFTASSLSNVAPANNQAGWTYLPSGILLRWDSITFTAKPVGDRVINNAGAPLFTKLFTVFITPVNNTANDVDFALRFINIVTPNQFRVYLSNRTTPNAYVGANAGMRFLMIGI